MAKEVNCNSCKKPIKSSEDLAVDFDFVSFTTYHKSCFPQFSNIFLFWRVPYLSMTGRSGTLAAILSSLFGVLLLYFILTTNQVNGFKRTIIFIIILIPSIILPITLRVYIHNKYEKNLI